MSAKENENEKINTSKPASTNDKKPAGNKKIDSTKKEKINREELDKQKDSIKKESNKSKVAKSSSSKKQTLELKESKIQEEKMAKNKDTKSNVVKAKEVVEKETRSKEVKNQNEKNKSSKSQSTKKQTSNSDTHKKETAKKQNITNSNSQKDVQKTSSKNIESKNINTTASSTKKANTKKSESKEEQVVFNNKSQKNKTQSKNNIKTNNEIKSDTKNSSAKTEIKKENKINTTEYFEDKEKKRRKVVLILINVIAILIILMMFSTFFAIVHTMKPTIAKGVSVNNIDISNLTYNEAQEKLEEAFNVVLETQIDLKNKDYSYTVKSSDISLVYNLNKVLDEAYSIGRRSNIITSNFSLIKTALFKKNISYNFEYNQEELDKIIDEVASSIPGLVKQYSYYIENDELIINPGADGIRVKKEELKNAIINNIQNRNPIELIKNFKPQQIEIPYEEVKAENIDIEKIYNEIYSEPKDAYYTEATETTSFQIFADEDGIDFAISMDEAKNIISEQGKQEYIIPLNRKKANVTINNLGIEAFPYLVGKATTNYDASNSSRSENLRIATSKIDGTVIMPGKQFSFNEVVGERTVAEGYKDAKIYSDGKVVDGLAGGICQISSTLYNAVLDGNLQVDERYNHSFKTSYLPAGKDATVVYGVKDFKFTNNRTFPIKIEAETSNGVVLFNIYGIEEEKEYNVNIIPVITDTTPYNVQTITDYKLAPGTTIVDQAGAPGYKVTTYKEVSLNGVVISKDVISNDVYKVMTRIVRVGPTPQVTSAPESQPTPEPAPAE